MVSALESWVDEMMSYVALIRPKLDPANRGLQRQSLVNFRTLYFEKISPSHTDKEKRGFLFEYLVLSDPRYPQRTEIEKQVSDYLINALKYNVFRFRGKKSHPDDIAIEIDGDTAFVAGLVEVKLNIHRPQVPSQLQAHKNLIKEIEFAINQCLVLNDFPPALECGLVWPESVKYFVVPDNYDAVVFKPADKTFVAIEGWNVIPALFSHREVRVIADFLWHL